MLSETQAVCPFAHRQGARHKSQILLIGCLSAVPLLAASGALAQTYPDRPVKLGVPFAPGGTTDIIARVVAAQIAPHFGGQSMVVETRAAAAE